MQMIRMLDTVNSRKKVATAISSIFFLIRCVTAQAHVDADVDAAALLSVFFTAGIKFATLSSMSPIMAAPLSMFLQ